MGNIKTIKWTLDPHTEAKHAILRKYLGAWFPIITSCSKKVIVVDGFTGPGEYKDGQDGSPIIAIKTFMEHSVKMDAEVIFFFIEKDKDRCECLKKKLKKFKMTSNVKYHVECSEFSTVIKSVLDDLASKGQKLAPSFFFIDPFGYKDIPMSLIKRIMSYEKCEVFINFMYEEINRFISVKCQEKNYNQLFGTEEWKKVTKITDPQKRIGILHNIYKRQLEEVAEIKYVRYFKMINKNNKTDYFLFFGTNNIKGLKHMKAAMWKVDETGDFQFSDATYDPNQATLFEPAPDYILLEKMILKKYKGVTISVEELEEFILIDTPFLDTHYKTKILKPMEENRKIKVYGERRRKGTYPRGKRLRIKFL